MWFRHLILVVTTLGFSHNLAGSDSLAKAIFSDAAITKNHDGFIYLTIDSPREIAGLQFSLEYDRDKILLGKPSFSRSNRDFSLYTAGDSGLMKVVAFSGRGKEFDLSESVLAIPLSSTSEYEGTLPLTVREFIASDPDGRKINLRVSAGRIYIIPFLPEEFRLTQNFPNPFNAETVIKFDLPEAALVQLAIYDVLGKVVRRLQNGEVLAAGFHSVTWDGTDDLGRPAASGEYVFSIKVGVRYHAMKMVLLR